MSEVKRDYGERKSYSELTKLGTFEERFNYLVCHSSIGIQTFGTSRYLNQMLYKDVEWLKARDRVILRDNGMDLGIDGAEIVGPITVHHINPITLEDVIYRRPCVFDEDNLISTSDKTHKAVHYGRQMPTTAYFQERTPGDTTIWKKVKTC